MFPVSVPRIFKNARRVFVTESLFSTLNLYILQLCRKLYHLHWYIPRGTSRTLSLQGCNATKNQTPIYGSGNIP